MKDFFKPHRVVLIVLALALVAWCALSLNWTWLANPKYQLLIVQGIWRTIWLVVVTMVIGMILAVPTLTPRASTFFGFSQSFSGVMFLRPSIGSSSSKT